MGENFKLRWNDHHSIFFSTAENFILGDHLTDVTLSCGKQEFSAHKLVLSICSTYFNELFTPKTHKQRPANSAAIVYLKDVDPHHLELLLNFMYRGEINVEEDELISLLSTAKGLQIRGLSDNEEEERSPSPQSENSNHKTIKSKPSSSSNTSKAVKRSKTPPSTSSNIPSTSNNQNHPSSMTPSKKIKTEALAGGVIAQPGPSHVGQDIENPYAEQGAAGDGGTTEEDFAGFDEVAAEEYNVEGAEEGDGSEMMYDGELPAPEVALWEFRRFEKPFHCMYCSMSFDRTDSLKRHTRTHTGEKPYKCPQCPKAFTQSGHMRSHQRKHHKEVIIEPRVRIKEIKEPVDKKKNTPTKNEPNAGHSAEAGINLVGSDIEPKIEPNQSQTQSDVDPNSAQQ